MHYTTREEWEKPWEIEGVATCSATHPDMPNHHGGARSRKTHLVGDLKAERTVCKMKVDRLLTLLDEDCGVFGQQGRKCKTCFK